MLIKLQRYEIYIGERVTDARLLKPSTWYFGWEPWATNGEYFCAQMWFGPWNLYVTTVDVSACTNFKGGLNGYQHKGHENS